MKKIHFLASLSAVLLTLAGGHSVLAADWPQWRGPNRDGKVTGFDVPETWPQQLAQRWKVAVGTGDSTPALVGGKLYAFGRQDANEVIVCLDAATGKSLWEAKYPADFVVTGPAARHPGPRSSPAVGDGKLCALGVGGILSCLNAATGEVLWRKQSTNDFLGIPYRTDAAMSPLIADGRCIVHVGGKTNGAAMVAFGLARGEPIWKWEGDGPSCGSPVLMTVKGTKQLVTLTAKSLVGIGLSDGRLLWHLPFEAKQGNNTTPVVDGQTVIYTGQGVGMFAVKIDAQGQQFAATPLWTNRDAGARFTTPVLKNGLLFGYNGHLFCASAQTGATLWTDSVSRGQSAAMLDAGTVLLALCVNSELAVFKPNDQQYTELARLKVAATETWAHPVLAGKRIFVRDQDSVTLWTVD